MIGFGWERNQGLVDILGVPINPATEDKQDDIIDAINNISGGGATSIGGGSKNVTSAGTAEQLSASSVPCKRVHIRAKYNNAGYVFIAGSGVENDQTNGVFLNPQDSLTLNISNLNAVWIDAQTNGEGVVFTYEN